MIPTDLVNIVETAAVGAAIFTGCAVFVRNKRKRNLGQNASTEAVSHASTQEDPLVVASRRMAQELRRTFVWMGDLTGLVSFEYDDLLAQYQHAENRLRDISYSMPKDLSVAYLQSVASSALAIYNRMRAFQENKIHFTDHKKHDMERALKTSFKDLLASINMTYNEIHGQPSGLELESYIMGTGPMPNKKNLGVPDEIVAKISAIYGMSDAALAALPPGSDPTMVHILRAARERYVPDTLRAFFESQRSDPQTAVTMLGDQIEQIRKAVEANSDAATKGDLSSLKVNERFLDSVLPNPAEN